MIWTNELNETETEQLNFLNVFYELWNTYVFESVRETEANGATMTDCRLQAHAPIHAQPRRQPNKDEPHSNTCTPPHKRTHMHSAHTHCQCIPINNNHYLRPDSCVCARRHNVNTQASTNVICVVAFICGKIFNERRLLFFFLCSFPQYDWVNRTLIQSSQIETTTFRCRPFNCSNIFFLFPRQLLFLWFKFKFRVSTPMNRTAWTVSFGGKLFVLVVLILFFCFFHFEF